MDGKYIILTSKTFQTRLRSTGVVSATTKESMDVLGQYDAIELSVKSHITFANIVVVVIS
jgi:hypothetical protein